MKSGKTLGGKLQRQVLQCLLKHGGTCHNYSEHMTGDGRHSDILRAIRSLEKGGQVTLYDNKIELTQKGRALLRRIELEDVSIKAPEEWDGKWRVVVYDMPVSRNIERRVFREKLKGLGFIKIQNSLWVYPYRCREEITFISRKLRVYPYVIYMRTSELPGESVLLEKFGLTRP